jgi:hypothetical protein
MGITPAVTDVSAMDTLLSVHITRAWKGVDCHHSEGSAHVLSHNKHCDTELLQQESRILLSKHLQIDKAKVDGYFKTRSSHLTTCLRTGTGTTLSLS